MAELKKGAAESSDCDDAGLTCFFSSPCAYCIQLSCNVFAFFCRRWANTYRRNVNPVECWPVLTPRQNTPSSPVRPLPTDIVQESLARGVTLGFLVDFTRRHGLWDWPTYKVVECIVKPRTKLSQCRFVDLDDEPGLPAAVGVADIFVSHAWASTWGALVLAATSCLPDDTRLWIDCFTVTQHAVAAQLDDLFCMTKVTTRAFLNKPMLTKATFSAGSTLSAAQVIAGVSAVLVVWELSAELFELLAGDRFTDILPGRPQSDLGKRVPFLRIWCIAEFYNALKAGTPLVLKVGSWTSGDCTGAEHAFVSVSAETVRERRAVNAALQLIDTQRASATVEADRLMILALIDQDVGAGALNSLVRGALIGAFSVVDFPEVQDLALSDNPAALERLHKLAAAGRINEQRGYLKQTALHVAASAGYTAVARALLELGADPSVGNISQRTAAMRAALAGHTAALELLLDASSTLSLAINATDDAMCSTLFLAAQGGHAGCCALLLDRSAAPDARDAEGRTPLMQAAFGGHEMVLGMLVQAAADVSAADTDGKTVLMRAAERGSEQPMRALLDAHADVHAADSDGITAALLAAENGHIECLHTLAEHGADLCARTHDGSTAALLAATNGKIESLTALRRLVGGTDPLQRDVANDDGETVLSVAESAGDSAMLSHVRGAVSMDE
eukprot:6193493-Pleurochrysis_carterae.AAC.1